MEGRVSLRVEEEGGEKETPYRSINALDETNAQGTAPTAASKKCARAGADGNRGGQGTRKFVPTPSAQANLRALSRAVAAGKGAPVLLQVGWMGRFIDGHHGADAVW